MLPLAKKTYGLDESGAERDPFTNPYTPKLDLSMFEEFNVGDEIARGTVHFTIGSAREDLDVDCEFLRTDDGIEFFDNSLFRGFYDRRVRLIKGENGLKVELVE